MENIYQPPIADTVPRWFCVSMQDPHELTLLVTVCCLIFALRLFLQFGGWGIERMKHVLTSPVNNDNDSSNESVDGLVAEFLDMLGDGEAG